MRFNESLFPALYGFQMFSMPKLVPVPWRSMIIAVIALNFIPDITSGTFLL